MATATIEPLEKLDSILEQRQAAAAEKYERMTFALADGAEISPDEMEATIVAAGKSAEDLRNDVKHIGDRREWSEHAKTIAPLEGEQGELLDKLESLREKYEREVAKVEARLAAIGKQLSTSKNRVLALRSSCPSWLAKARIRCIGRIRKFRQYLRYPEPKRGSTIIVENGTTRQEPDPDFPDRLAAHEKFQAEANAAIEALVVRRAKLHELAMVPTPTPEMVAEVDKRFPEPESVVCPYFQTIRGKQGEI